MAVPDRRASPPKPLDARRLEDMAIRYVGRYATTRHRLADYLRRKLRERGWAGEDPPPVDALAERMVTLGYVDDRAFAAAKTATLGRRGYGPGRVEQALRAAGIDADGRAESGAEAAAAAEASALAFARRRRIGPYASGESDRAARAKAFAALVRAGHAPDLARRIVATPPEGDLAETD